MKAFVLVLLAIVALAHAQEHPKTDMPVATPAPEVPKPKATIDPAKPVAPAPIISGPPPSKAPSPSAPAPTPSTTATPSATPSSPSPSATPSATPVATAPSTSTVTPIPPAPTAPSAGPTPTPSATPAVSAPATSVPAGLKEAAIACESSGPCEDKKPTKTTGGSEKKKKTKKERKDLHEAKLMGSNGDVIEAEESTAIAEKPRRVRKVRKAGFTTSYSRRVARLRARLRARIRQLRRRLGAKKVGRRASLTPIVDRKKYIVPQYKKAEKPKKKLAKPKKEHIVPEIKGESEFFTPKKAAKKAGGAAGYISIPLRSTALDSSPELADHMLADIRGRPSIYSEETGKPKVSTKDFLASLGMELPETLPEPDMAGIYVPPPPPGSMEEPLALPEAVTRPYPKSMFAALAKLGVKRVAGASAGIAGMPSLAGIDMFKKPAGGAALPVPSYGLPLPSGDEIPIFPITSYGSVSVPAGLDLDAPKAKYADLISDLEPID